MNKPDLQADRPGVPERIRCYEMKKHWIVGLIGFLLLCSYCIAVETGMYRLLSVSESEKIILVSQIPTKAKLLLDASSAKVTVNGKAAEFKELRIFSILQVKADLKKSSKNGVAIDGSVTEIKVSNAEKAK
jgi:hypothetical protein